MQHVSVCWSEHGEEGARLRGTSVCTIMCVFRKLCSFCVQLIRIETKKCFAQHTIPALLSFIRFAFPKSSPATTAWLTSWWLFCSTYLRSGGRLWSLMKKVTLTAAICECRLWCSTKRKRFCVCFSQVFVFFCPGKAYSHWPWAPPYFRAVWSSATEAEVHLHYIYHQIL